MPSTCEVREMRRAEAELVIILWSLESGLRSKDSVRPVGRKEENFRADREVIINLVTQLI